jgi:ankyrin repeat protein
MRALVHECGADATVADKDGDTPVSLASQNGHTETVRALVQECGVDTRAANEKGVTPVLFAAHTGLLLP